MTTSRSPLRLLKATAEAIAKNLKYIERGELGIVAPAYRQKLVEASKRDGLKFAIAMDDKLITIYIPWTKLKETGEVALAEFILKQMKDSREH